MKKTIKYRVFLFCLSILLAGSGSLYATTYIVTLTADPLIKGKATPTPGTLRWAITQANANPGPDMITFNILAGTGITFESSGTNSWAVITLLEALPVITEEVIIDGTTQPNTNVGFIAGKTVGVNSFIQGNINYPDVYIVPGYALPTSDAGFDGNGLAVNAPNVTIKGLALSGFGNESTAQTTGIAHADISILHSATARVMNTVISDCFISSDPRGNMPTGTRNTKGSGLLILANNNFGTIKRNYVSYSGGYGIVFHANQNNSSSQPNIAPSTNWVLEENQVVNIGTSTVYAASSGRAADGISMMHTRNCLVKNNYVADWEQFGIDLGHNTDDNRVENNTLTGFTKTIGSAPCGAIRTGFSSERDSVIKNEIYNNTSAIFLGGIWADESITSLTGGNTKNSRSFYYSQNSIHDNINSGITLSTNGTGTLTAVTITQNSIYNNTGLGIDLGYTDLSGPTQVTVDDSGDPDAGTNDLQNFPIIDSVKYNASNTLMIWGKAPAASTLEFFVSDGQWNRHGGRLLDYGEGKTFIGAGIEGSIADEATATALTYNIDGNIATNNVNAFQFTFPFSGLTNTDSITATATLNNNTSEFGPKTTIIAVLGVSLFEFNGHNFNNMLYLNWTALCDNQFDYFIIEKSVDGTNFTTFTEERNIKYNQQANYNFSTQAQIDGNSFYRIKMINKDGSYTHSKVLKVNNTNGGAQAVKVIANPFENHLATQVKLDKTQMVNFKLSNSTGHIIEQKAFLANAGINYLSLDNLGKLAKGVYILHITMGNDTFTQAVIKK